MEPLKLPIDWEILKQDFLQDDMMLRDIVISECDLTTWDAVLLCLKQSEWPWKYMIAGDNADIPGSAQEIFVIRSQTTPYFQVTVEGIEINTYFFTQQEIEFDLLAKEITSPDRLLAVMSFMKVIGTACGKPVSLTTEGPHDPDTVILQYETSFDRFTYLPPKYPTAK